MTYPDEISVRPAGQTELEAILDVHRRAFGTGPEDEGEAIVRVLVDLHADETARPLTSLVAVDEGGAIIGHVLFSPAGMDNAHDCALLAPLAVVPEWQTRGVGGRLVRAGLERLTREGVRAAFVWGDPAYYGRFGFAPSPVAAPQPIPAEYAAGWQMLVLDGAALPAAKARLQVARTWDDPVHWAL